MPDAGPGLGTQGSETQPFPSRTFLPMRTVANFPDPRRSKTRQVTVMSEGRVTEAQRGHERRELISGVCACMCECTHVSEAHCS